jgi:phage/plasmid-associated DNA primase
MNKIAERPKHVYTSARYWRNVGPRNAGCRVSNMHPPALVDTWTLSVWNGDRRTARLTAYKTPVYNLQRRIARKCKMYRWETGSPHEQYDATEVKSITERCDRRRDIPRHMAAAHICVSFAVKLLQHIIRTSIPC